MFGHRNFSRRERDSSAELFNMMELNYSQSLNIKNIPGGLNKRMAVTVIVSLYKMGHMLLDSLKLVDIGSLIRVPDT